MTAHILDSRPATPAKGRPPRAGGIARLVALGAVVLVILAGGAAWMYFAMAPMIEIYTVSD